MSIYLYLAFLRDLICIRIYICKDFKPNTHLWLQLASFMLLSCTRCSVDYNCSYLCPVVSTSPQ